MVVLRAWVHHAKSLQQKGRFVPSCGCHPHSKKSVDLWPEINSWDMPKSLWKKSGFPRFSHVLEWRKFAEMIPLECGATLCSDPKYSLCV